MRLLDYRVLELVINQLAAAPGLTASVNVVGGFHRRSGLVGGARRHAARQYQRGGAADHRDNRTRRSRMSPTRAASSPGSRISAAASPSTVWRWQYLVPQLAQARRGCRSKIDGAFVQNIVKSSDDRAFVHTLIDLSGRLGLKTVAEWVQDERSRATLGKLGLRFAARRADRARRRRAAVAGRGPRRDGVVSDYSPLGPRRRVSER